MGEAAWDYYFSGVLPSLIHILTSSEDFQTAGAIAKKLRIPANTADSHLRSLAKFDFVTFQQDKWKYASPSIHFPKHSKQNLMMQLIRRHQAVSSLLSQREDATHFSTLFTLDQGSYEKLRKNISDFVMHSQKLIHQGGADNPYVFSIDLFDPSGMV